MGAEMLVNHMETRFHLWKKTYDVYILNIIVLKLFYVIENHIKNYFSKNLNLMRTKLSD